MGCDIHLYAEIKIRGNSSPFSTWQLYSRIPFVRWYGAFEKLAGVRGDVENAIAAPRGLPDDVSFAVKFQHDYMKCDAHSASWIDREEIKIFDDWIRKEPAHRQPKIFEHFDIEYEGGIYFFGNDFSTFEPKGVEDLRFVFWFDN